MRFERPRIVHREPIEALLSPAVKSAVGTPDGISDARVKEHVRPVTWADEATAYTPPAIDGREPVSGLLDTVISDGGPTPDGDTSFSDARIKEHVRPVTWGDEATAYTPPAITDREPLAGLLTDTVISDGGPAPDGDTGAPSDVRIKRHVVPVRW